VDANHAGGGDRHWRASRARGGDARIESFVRRSRSRSTHGPPEDTHTLPPHVGPSVTLRSRWRNMPLLGDRSHHPRGKTARVLSALQPTCQSWRPRVRIRSRAVWRSHGVAPVIADLSGDMGAVPRGGRELVLRGVIPAGATLVLVSVTPDLSPVRQISSNSIA
jgi:hypothetical protein